MVINVSTCSTRPDSNANYITVRDRDAKTITHCRQVMSPRTQLLQFFYWRLAASRCIQNANKAREQCLNTLKSFVYALTLTECYITTAAGFSWCCIFRQPDVSRNALSFTDEFFLSFFFTGPRFLAAAARPPIKCIPEVRS